MSYSAVPVTQEPRRTIEQVFAAWLYGKPLDAEERRRLRDTALEMVDELTYSMQWRAEPY